MSAAALSFAVGSAVSGRPSRADAQAAARGNQQAANQLRQQGRERDARAAENAAQVWRDYLAQQ